MGVPSVLVLGSLNVDHILRVPGLPDPGQTVLSTGYSIVPGGKGRNQAAAVAALGGTVTMAGALGDDRPGDQLRQDLIERGVDVSLLQSIAGVPSGLAAITVDRAGENTIVVHAGANAKAAPVPAEALEQGKYGVLLCSLEIPLATVAATVETARARGVTTIVNAAPMVGAGDDRLASILDHTDVVVVNRSEAAELAGGGAPEEDPVAAIAAWRAGGGPAVIVTLGAAGAALIDDAGSVTFSAVPVLASSTVGAGDTFAGALALGVATGKPVAEVVPEAMAAAAAFLAGDLTPIRVRAILTSGDRG